MIEHMTPCEGKLKNGQICKGTDFSLRDLSVGHIVRKAITCTECSTTHEVEIDTNKLIALEWNKVNK